MTFHEVGYTTGTDEHDTPAEFFGPIAAAVDGFDLDPCASATSDLADENVRLDGGLDRPWHGRVFLNPPYSEVSEWLAYAADQHAHGHTDLTVALVFARTGTRWFHTYATTADRLCFIEGRLSFGDERGSAPAPSMVVVWGTPPDALTSLLDRRGLLVSP